MAKVTYEMVEHDGGWAYRVNGVFSGNLPKPRCARHDARS